MNEKFIQGTVEELCNVEYGTRVVRKKDAGTIFPVYGGGGETFFLDTFNRENRVVVARFAMSEKCTRRVTGKFALNDSGLTLSPRDPAKLRQEYLDYFVLGMNDQIYASARGTAQKNLDVPAFRQMRISFPASPEKQIEIVERLDNTFAEVDSLENNLGLFDSMAEQLLNSILGAACTTPQHKSESSRTVESQELAIKSQPLGEVFTLEYGKALDTEFRNADGAFRAYGANGPISSASKYLIEGPCVIVGRKGSAGEITYVEDNVWPLDVTYYIKHNSEETDLRYLFYTLKSLNIKQFVRGVKPGLNRNDVYELSIQIPSLQKQRDTAAKLDSVFSEIESLRFQFKKQKDDAVALRQSLLSIAFTELEEVA